MRWMSPRFSVQINCKDTDEHVILVLVDLEMFLRFVHVQETAHPCTALCCRLEDDVFRREPAIRKLT